MSMGVVRALRAVMVTSVHRAKNSIAEKNEPQTKTLAGGEAVSKKDNGETMASQRGKQEREEGASGGQKQERGIGVSRRF